MHPIDYENWPRKAIFEFFSATELPFYSVTFNLDVTNLLRYTREHQLPFYEALTYFATKAVNGVDAFSYSICNGAVVKLEDRTPSFTDLDKETELFRIVTPPPANSLEDYCEKARKAKSEQKSFITEEAGNLELVYISCLPWIELTSLTNEHSLNKDDAFPRIGWGKYVERDGRKILGISIEVNHRFIDGVHIGKFGQLLQQMIDELKE